MATFESYTSPKATGATKEDLDPKLNLLAQMETPVYSSIGRGTTTNRYPDWIERDLAAAAANAHSEGQAFSSEAVDGGTRRTNATQIFQKGYEVTGTEQASASVTYEGKKRLAELRAIHGLEMKRDIEYAIISNTNTASAGATGATGTPRQISDYWDQIDSSVSNAQATATSSLGYDTGTIFEDLINETAADLYATGGLTYKMGNSFVKNANMLILNPTVKVAFDQRLDAKSSTYRMTNSGKMLGVDVTKYGSSFGDLMVCPDVHCPVANAAVMNPQNWKWLVLRATHEQEIAKVGDAERRQLVHEGTLMHRHRKASGAITGLAVST